MAKKTAIANPIVLLGLDSSQLTSGIGKTISAVKLSGAQIGKAMSAGMAGAFRSPLMAVAGLNQAMELSAKISKTLGAPIQALMGREQLQAKFSGTGTIDPMGGTFTAGIARFASAFDTMLADIAESLDRTFDLKGKLEYARGALSGISALLTAFFGNLEPIINDPEALTKQFKAGALIIVDVFEWAANTSQGIYDNVVTALSMFGINLDIFNDVFGGVISMLTALANKDTQDTAAGIMAWMLSWTDWADNNGIGGNAIPDALNQIRQENNNIRNNLNGPVRDPLEIGAGPNIAGIAQQARNNINAMGLMAPADAEKLLMQRAGVIMGKIGGDLAPQIANKIAPLMASGSAQLEDALVKAQLQGEAGDIQKRIESAIQQQLEQQKLQTKMLNRIRDVIAGNNNPLAVLGDN